MTDGERTKKPPLIQAPSPRGFIEPIRCLFNSARAGGRNQCFLSGDLSVGIILGVVLFRSRLGFVIRMGYGVARWMEPLWDRAVGTDPVVLTNQGSGADYCVTTHFDIVAKNAPEFGKPSRHRSAFHEDFDGVDEVILLFFQASELNIGQA